MTPHGHTDGWTHRREGGNSGLDCQGAVKVSDKVNISMFGDFFLLFENEGSF